MKSIAIVGAQWGDEGKGKIVHLLSEKADVICRYQGGNNAGHTVVTAGKKYVLHLIPSGILKEGKICIIGNGLVLNPFAFLEETNTLRDLGINIDNRIFISDRVQLIMPYHIELDKVYEEELGIGTTKRGIGPAYTYKYARIGIRACDLSEPAYLDRLIPLVLEEVNSTLSGRFGRRKVNTSDVMKTIGEYRKILDPFTVNISKLLSEFLRENRKIIYEGAQGGLLDVDFGSYPFVTSSNPTIGGVLTGLGIGPRAIGQVLGIAKAYTTRVGGGPFPTELSDETGNLIRKRGDEFGASTGRPRRCGWFDVVSLKHALMVSGIEKLAMTKFDVLDNFETVKVCTAYNIDGADTKDFPANASMLERARPVYEEFDGWEVTSHIRSYDELPQGAKNYVKALEHKLGVEVVILSTGPDEEDTIIRGKDIFD
jgi:adenylosuccinate synthase